MINKKACNRPLGVVLIAVVLMLVCAVQVSASSGTGATKPTKVRQVNMLLDSVTVRVNQTRTLSAYVSPSDAEDQTLYWASSNSEIVVVDEEGGLTGISPGTAEVTATSENGRVGRCQVTVPQTPIQSEIFRTDTASEDLVVITGGETLWAAALRVDTEEAVKEAASGSDAALTYKDKTTVSTAALRGADYAARAKGAQVRIRLQTLANDGSIQGQLTIDPAKAPAEDAELQVRVYTQASETESAYKQAASYFKNPVAVVELSQQGAFGMSVQVAAKTILSEVSMQGAKLYLHDGQRYIEQDEASLWLDSNGFIHFTTAQGGIFIVTV